jgi:hypothetical protein
MAEKSARIIEFFSSSGFLESESSFLQYHSFTWPSAASVNAFYEMATLLLPQSEWNK